MIVTNKRPKIHHIVPHVHNEASGPSFTVPALCEALALANAGVELHVLEPGIASPFAFPVHSYRAAPFPARLGLSRDMSTGLREAARHADILFGEKLF